MANRKDGHCPTAPRRQVLSPADIVHGVGGLAETLIAARSDHQPAPAELQTGRQESYRFGRDKRSLIPMVGARFMELAERDGVAASVPVPGEFASMK